ncbi:hypothetical protein WJX72_003820 [[Myrmecia] bisecta]|uniref:DNA 3'-5' helicase n=1 Tax=[Myrmecia] bisecta TaxID=41462 RepID=A0AAW1R5N1_9CHLO
MTGGACASEAKLALFVLLIPSSHRPHAVRVLRWAWAESAPERYSPLLRESVRELVACLLVLLRKAQWKDSPASPATELHDALDGELQRLEAQDDNTANVQRIQTSTLRALTEMHTDKQFLYIAFNRGTVDKAQEEFDSRNVTCRTSHSVAYSMCLQLEQSGKRCWRKGSIPWSTFAEALRTHNTDPNIASYRPGTFESFGKVVKLTVDKFCTSTDTVIGEQHVPDRVEWPPVNHQPDYVAWAQHVWRRMSDPQDRFPFSFITYLKLYVMTHPTLVHPHTRRRYDSILVDEAQDLNPITYELVRHQPCTKIYVGDSHQHIYSFDAPAALHGSCDILSKVDAAKRFALTISFRMGPEVAMVANRVLAKLKTGTRAIVGLGDRDSRMWAQGVLARWPEGPGTRPRYQQPHFICRTNNGWLCAAAELVQKVPGIKLHLEVARDKQSREPNSFAKVRDGYLLFAGAGRPTAPDMRRFQTYGALKAHAKATEDPELLSAVRVVDKFQHQTMAVLGRILAARVPEETPEQADVVLATCHQVKGMEFNHVQLNDDFIPCSQPLDVRPDEANRRQLVDEYNLLYVAVSRARHTLILNRDLRDFLMGVPAKQLSVTRRDPALLARLAVIVDDGAAANRQQGHQQEVRQCGCCLALFLLEDAVLDVTVMNQGVWTLACPDCARRSIYGDLTPQPIAA